MNLTGLVTWSHARSPETHTEHCTQSPVASATKSVVPARKSPIRTWEAIMPIAVALILALLPAPPGLPHFVWTYFSIFAGVIVGWFLNLRQ